ncbi:ribosomal RNA processing protein 36 homolog [Cottoperca gobio]|uniref:rRNA biogenesis protein RRP36 n=1 Tax=Cottoperca gobio TaxID=56716 RepID=A0A6J2PGM7_COTGO|nr:ribosomal RNA processing protein 36 homolog [Cottoperca gobio]
MKGKEKQRREPAVSKKKNMAASSSDDEDSDVERNFALLTERGGAEEGEPYLGGEEEFSDEDEEGSDGGTKEQEGEEGSEAGEEEGAVEEDEEEDGDSEASEEDDEDPEEAGGSSEIQTRDDVKKELSNMSFEDIMKLQNKVGTKVYNEIAYGSNRSQGSSKKKRLNKNRPMEISAKRRAPFLRQVVSVKKPTLRDPRFDDLSGEYKPEIFEMTYKFINDIKHREKEIVQKQLKKTKTNNNNNIQRKEKLQFLLKRMENQERARKSREEERERELQFKRQQRERATQGDRPFFLKNSDKKKLQLAEKYQELKKSGKLENFLSKKRKRNAGKDRRKLPRQLQN